MEKAAKDILEVLVNHLPNVEPGKPETYLSYKEIHDKLSLKHDEAITWGESLKRQGLSSLAHWTVENDLPGITGIIISQTTYMPGKGYFSVFNRNENDFKWWKGEVEKSKAFDWSPYL